MSAKGSLRGELRDYGYADPPGLSVVASQAKNIDFYDALRKAGGDGIPTVCWRGQDSEWLACMRLSDFMQIYREWEMNTAEVRELPFYGSGDGADNDN